MSDTALTRPDEAIALRLIQAIRADAEAVCAPDQVDLVSVTFDVAAAGAEPGNLTYKPRIDPRPAPSCSLAAPQKAPRAS